jgi:predicted alpha/beta superfamily hydrolase
MKFSYYLLAIFVFILSSNRLHAESIDTQLLQSLGDVNYYELNAENLDRSFHVFIDLPLNYSESTETYPTVYLLDGGTTFPLLAAYHHYLRFEANMPAVILVGISYGADTFEEGNLRSTDYTVASAERDYWGGASAFQSVLRDELLPYIEKNYRSDSSRRVIFGQSLGGQFVLFNALTEPQLFFGHIASNPALHRNLDFFLQWQGEDKMPVNASRVFVSSGEFDDQRFREPAMKWAAHWQAISPKPWLLEVRTLTGQTHMSAAPEAFRQGLDWLFSETENSQ